MWYQIFLYNTVNLQASIEPVDGAQPGQNGHKSDGHKGVHHIAKKSQTGTLSLIYTKGDDAICVF